MSGVIYILKYWKFVFSRAFHSTLALFPLTSEPRRALVNSIIPILTIIFVGKFLGENERLTQLGEMASYLLALALVFFAIYLMNLVAIPAQINKEKDSTIGSLISSKNEWEITKEKVKKLRSFIERGQSLAPRRIVADASGLNERIKAWNKEVSDFLHAEFPHEADLYDTLPTGTSKDITLRLKPSPRDMKLFVNARIDKLRKILGRAAAGLRDN